MKLQTTLTHGGYDLPLTAWYTALAFLQYLDHVFNSYPQVTVEV